jgi:hypothetical protein
VSNPMPADRERETEQVETAIASLRAAVVDDNTLAEWFRPGYLLEVANLLDRLRGDAREVEELRARSAELRSVHCEIGDALSPYMPDAGRVPSFVQRAVFAVGSLRSNAEDAFVRVDAALDALPTNRANSAAITLLCDLKFRLAAAIDRARSTPGGET